MHARSIPLLVVFQTLALTAAAQHSGVGIKGGPLLSSTRSGSTTSRSMLGGSFGLYFPLRGADRLELQPELLVTSLGSNSSRPDGTGVSDRTIYVQLPLSAKFYFNNTINVQAGVQLGYLLWAQRSSDGSVQDVKERYEQMDLGLVLGAGVDLIQGIDIGVRYYNGLKAVAANSGNVFPRNQAYMLTIGYRLARLRSPKFNRRRG